MMTKKEPADITEPVYSKEQLIRSKTLSPYRDVLASVLEDKRAYTKDQAEGLVQKYLKRKV